MKCFLKILSLAHPKRPYIWIALFVFAAISILLFKNIHDFLSANKPIHEAEYVLVEGWLDEYYYNDVVSNINSNNYSKVITTGGQLPLDYTMFTNSTLIFDTENLLKKDRNSIQKITINCTGTPVNYEFPYVVLSANKIVLAEFYASKSNHDYILWIPDSIGKLEEFTIGFYNDATAGLHDRNLILHSIEFDGQKVPIRQKGVSIDMGNWDGIEHYSVEVTDYANQAADQLTRYTVDREMIIPIPAQNNNNRTLGHALAVRDWIQANNVNIKSINILTKGTHARRSYMIYKSILPDSVEVGVVSYPPFNYDPNRWWKSHLGRYTVHYETAAMIYYAVVLLFV